MKTPVPYQLTQTSVSQVSFDIIITIIIIFFMVYWFRVAIRQSGDQWHYGQKEHPNREHIVGIGIDMHRHTELDQGIVVVVNAGGANALWNGCQVCVGEVDCETVELCDKK